jgi:hypothetical protein
MLAPSTERILMAPSFASTRWQSLTRIAEKSPADSVPLLKAARGHCATLDCDLFARPAAGGFEADRVIAGLDGAIFDVDTLARIDVDAIVIGEADRANADV